MRKHTKGENVWKKLNAEKIGRTLKKYVKVYKKVRKMVRECAKSWESFLKVKKIF